MTTATFQPTPSQRSQALDLLANPDLSLREVARRLSATLESLSQWAILPATQALIADVEALARSRMCLAAADTLPSVVTALAAGIAKPATITPPDATPEHHRRVHETIRRSGALLTRLARLAATETTRSSPPRGSRSATTSPTNPAPHPAPVIAPHDSDLDESEISDAAAHAFYNALCASTRTGGPVPRLVDFARNPAYAVSTPVTTSIPTALASKAGAPPPSPR